METHTIHPLFYIIRFLRTPSWRRRQAVLLSSFAVFMVLFSLFSLSGHMRAAALEVPRSVGALRPLELLNSSSKTPFIPISDLPGIPDIPAKSATASAATAGRVWPMRGFVSLEFGAPDLPYMAHHTGIDIAGPAGTPITTFAPGKVIKVGAVTAGCGQCVFVDHGNGLESHYSHMSAIKAQVGQMVMPGDIIGYAGSTGWSTGPHVHFEITVNGVPVNPRGYVPGNPQR